MCGMSISTDSDDIASIAMGSCTKIFSTTGVDDDSDDAVGVGFGVDVGVGVGRVGNRGESDECADLLPLWRELGGDALRHVASHSYQTVQQL